MISDDTDFFVLSSLQFLDVVTPIISHRCGQPNAINLPFGDCFCHPFMVTLGWFIIGFTTLWGLILPSLVATKGKINSTREEWQIASFHLFCGFLDAVCHHQV